MSGKIATRKSTIHGNGMFAVEALKKGERLIEYKGKRRTHAEVDRDDAGDVESLEKVEAHGALNSGELLQSCR